jgi:acyl carrier protein
MQRINQNTFEIIKDIIARNLEIDQEAIDLEFKFHHFIDRMAEHRQKLSGAEDLLDYIEAANIYIDLSEAFDLHFFADFTDCACITVGDLVNLIQLKLDSLV